MSETNNVYKVIVAGSRGFNDYALLEEELKLFLKGRYPSEVEIVSGTANGADKLGERFAIENSCHLKLFPADWTVGKQAGVLRNVRMADYADACIVFWDGVSKGAKHMFNIAKKKELKTKLVIYK